MVPSSIGDSLGGRYRLTGVLGSGGMATVYRARDELLGRDVAVKLFPPVPLDADELGRHRAEVMVLAMLTHPGLVTLYDAGATPTDAGMHESYLVMELVEGPSLAAHLARGSLGTDQAALLGSQIADALVTVHTAGIVHRDIKPANILLVDGDSLDRIAPGPSTGPAVKLADFGIARVAGAERLTATGTTLGTASYLSPEQAVGGAVDAATDVYALGLVLLESITGAPAFTGTVAEIAVARLHRSPDVPPALGPAWTEVLTAMTEREPDLRPTTRDVADAL
ncbi:MAG: serine/threonine protein kinase, partial [Cellulomonadaceae bacterium]|nr:serine/threonine protein kinase [Cellulomonadaceae bacterium]